MNDRQKNVLKMLVDAYPEVVSYEDIGSCRKKITKAESNYQVATQIISKLRKLFDHKAFKSTRKCGYKINDEFIEDLRKVVYQTSDELTTANE